MGERAQETIGNVGNAMSRSSVGTGSK